MCFTFSLLDDSRVNESFTILELAARWLGQKGRRQRIAHITRPIYQKWQSKRANFIVTEQDQIVGIATLRQEPLDEWPEFYSLGTVYMIRALATHPDHRGKGIGEFAIREIIKRCGNSSAVYLDCVNDFLPRYYEKLGFHVIARQQRQYHDDEAYDIVLMQTNIAGDSN